MTLLKIGFLIFMCFTIAELLCVNCCAENPFIGKYHFRIIKVLHLFYHNFNYSDLSSNTIFWIILLYTVYLWFMKWPYRRQLYGARSQWDPYCGAHFPCLTCSRKTESCSKKVQYVQNFNSFPRLFFKKSRDNVTSSYKETNFWTIKLLTIN